ncbi:hypothetical protein ABZ575_27510, partial [Streptomyces sp. NPDC018347]
MPGESLVPGEFPTPEGLATLDDHPMPGGSPALGGLPTGADHLAAARAGADHPIPGESLVPGEFPTPEGLATLDDHPMLGGSPAPGGLATGADHLAAARAGADHPTPGESLVPGEFPTPEG